MFGVAWVLGWRGSVLFQTQRITFGAEETAFQHTDCNEVNFYWNRPQLKVLSNYLTYSFSGNPALFIAYHQKPKWGCAKQDLSLWSPHSPHTAKHHLHQNLQSSFGLTGLQIKTQRFLQRRQTDTTWAVHYAVCQDCTTCI